MFAANVAVAAAALAHGAVAAGPVFVHFMVANSYAYDVAQWKKDIVVAQDMGVDGFALNWTPPDCSSNMDWTIDRIADAYTAAEQSGFKLMYSFDMSWSSCNIYWNQTFMKQMIDKHAGSSATQRWNTNILVSTYGGDQVTQYGNNFFEDLKNAMKSSNAITLAPALTSYSMNAQHNPQGAASSLINDYPSADGYFNWQAWPLDVAANMSTTADQAFQSALRNAGRTGPYIMALSPWQFKDLNNGNSMDSWVSYSDTLFPARFKQLTEDQSVHPDIVEIVSWNDFCESHYLRDLPSQDKTATDYADLSQMGAYVYGQDHAAWRVMAKYYLHWYKYGAPPTITQDLIVFWYRLHPKAAVCTGGASSDIRNHYMPADAVFAWALVTRPAKISLSLGSNKYWEYNADNTGSALGMVPFPEDLDGDGSYPEVAVMRDGKAVVWGKGTKPVQQDCAWQNFNPVVNLAGGQVV